MGGVKKITSSPSAIYFYQTDSCGSLSKQSVPLKTSQIALENIQQILVNPDYKQLKRKLSKSHINNIRFTVLEMLTSRNFTELITEISNLSFKTCFKAIVSIIF